MESLKSDYGFAMKSRQRETSEELEEKIKSIDFLNKLSILVAIAVIILFGLAVKHTIGNPYYFFPNFF